MYAIHGYCRGEIVPTLALTLAHKHPDDLPRILKVNEELFTGGGHVAIYHRVIDAQGREHKVLTAGEAFIGAHGELRSVAGVMLDLTATVHDETAVAAREAVDGAMGTRCLIAQASGILMGRGAVTAEEAFGMLRAYATKPISSSRTSRRPSFPSPSASKTQSHSRVTFLAFSAAGGLSGATPVTPKKPRSLPKSPT